MTRRVARICSFAVIMLALAWSVAVILNGRVLAGKAFVAAWSDMQVALALNVLALICMVILMATASRHEHIN
jgi:hypothetical protein